MTNLTLEKLLTIQHFKKLFIIVMH